MCLQLSLRYKFCIVRRRSSKDSRRKTFQNNKFLSRIFEFSGGIVNFLWFSKIGMKNFLALSSTVVVVESELKIKMER